MSRWDKLKQRPDLMARVCTIYGPHFPIEVRYFLCQWIEGQDWSSVSPDNPAHEKLARQLLREMIDQLQSKCAELTAPDFLLIRMQFEATQVHFQRDYEKDPLNFVRIIQACLQQESALLKEIPDEEEPEPEHDGELVDMQEEDQYTAIDREVTELLNDVSKRTMQQQGKLLEMQNRQENFIIMYQENVNINSCLQGLELLPPGSDRTTKEKMLKQKKEEVERNLSQQAKQLLGLRLQMGDLVSETTKQMQVVQRRVLDEELINWKRRQQLAGNGLTMEPRQLDLLQSWCEQLADQIWLLRQQIKKVSSLRAQLPIDFPLNKPDVMPDLNDVVTGLLSSLVTSTFIVELQPPQVLKKDSRFSAAVRLLVGSKLNVHMNPPTIKATIISEHQAKMLLRSDMAAKDQKSGEILNNSGTFEFKPCSSGSESKCSGFLVTQFRNMQLKRIKRSDKKGSEAVTEEKFCILFQSDFTVGGNDLVFQVWTLSLPVVVTVHGNQECNALGTVLWDNAFSEPGRTPFLVPDSVPWSLLAEQLNMKFHATVGRGLTEDNLNYLASKIFGYKPDYSQVPISWSQFNKDSLKDRNFTFWEWFYNVLKLTKEHLKGPWTDGSIMGFVSKQEAQDLLNQVPNGTFLLRFSDSECGGITIAWIAESNARVGEREVWNLHPFSGRDFVIRGLADRIRDLGNLTNLYPNIPKDQAFSKYYTVVTESDKQPTTNGYIRPHLVTVVSMPKGCSDTSSEYNPQTPSSTIDYNPNTPNDIPMPVSPSDQGLSVQTLQMSDDLPSTMDLFYDAYATDYDATDMDNLSEISRIQVNQLLQSIHPS